VIPIEWKLSEKVTMRFGYQDGRIELVVKVSPLLPSVTLVMDEDEVPKAIEALEKAREFNARRPK
jgi:hypothetical protein